MNFNPKYATFINKNEAKTKLNIFLPDIPSKTFFVNNTKINIKVMILKMDLLFIKKSKYEDSFEL